MTGQRAAVSRQIDEAFRRSGTAHLLAVSGAHVGMIALGAWWVGRLLLRRPRHCALLVLGLVVLYALLLEPNAPAMRAVIASVLGVLAVLAGRPLSPGNLLAAAAITLLAISPTDLFSAGFQLSFVAVTALLAICPIMYRLLFGPHTTAGWVVHRIRYKDWPRAVYWPLETLRLYCSTNVTAWVAVAPLVAYHFGMFNTYGPVATMLMLPLASAALFVGFAKLLLGTILPTLGGLMARPAGWLGALMARQAEALGSWPFASVSASGPSIWLMVAWYALLLAWVILVRRGQVRARSPAEQARAAGTGLSADPAGGPPTSWLHPNLRLAMPPSAPIHAHAVVLAAAALVLAYFITSAPARPPDAPRMHVLAVGDGLSVVIQGPNGRNLLYDCGSLNLPAPAETVALPALRALGIDRIHAAFVSHPNLDHYGGIAALAKAIPVERLITTEAFLAAAEQGAPGRLLRDLAALHVPVETCRRGDRIEGLGPLELEVLWPPSDPPAPLTSANDTSLVLRISHGQTRALLTGDIEQAAQLHLVDQSAETLAAGLLVLPHHGSPRCLLEPFLEAVRPRTAVASTGDRTRAAGIRRTGRLAAELFDTANDGMITIDLLADGPRTCPFRRRGGPPSLASEPTPAPD